MPTEPLLDIMRRTMTNLAFVEANEGPNGPYEVTQLLNSFLGALVHPWEAMQDDLMKLSMTEARSRGFPFIQKELSTDADPDTFGALLRLMRHGMAHGNIAFIADDRAQIRGVRIWNTDPRNRARTWGAEVVVNDMRRFLVLFVQLIEERHRTP
jgi:hypothetical protein